VILVFQHVYFGRGIVFGVVVDGGMFSRRIAWEVWGKKIEFQSVGGDAYGRDGMHA
jgi:hypothetical protein